MDTWGNLVRRIAGERTENRTRDPRGGLTIKPIVESVSDPDGVVASVAERLELARADGRPASAWSRRRQSAQTGATPHGAPTLNGRPCCYEHLSQFEGRADLKLPHETTCPGCSAVYRIRLSTVRR